MIGTDRTGRTALPNSFGIETQSVTDALITDNVISGNSGPGITFVVTRGRLYGATDRGRRGRLERSRTAGKASGSPRRAGCSSAGRPRPRATSSPGTGKRDPLPQRRHPEHDSGQLHRSRCRRPPSRKHGLGDLLLRPADAPGLNVIGGVDEGAGNVIAYNGEDGINITNFVSPGPRASILGNSIHSNGLVGIDLEALGPPGLRRRTTE